MHVVLVRNVDLEAVNLNGMILECPPHSRADDVDDAGLGKKIVIHVQGIEGTRIGEEPILGVIVWFKEEITVYGTDR